MIKDTLRRGFTLIELLVVIAIIGILASVVLASLNSARDKGEDAAVKSSLNNARAQAAIYYDDNGNYENVCDSLAQFGGTCSDQSDSWIVHAELTATSSSYCVDSTGKATTTTTASVVEADSCE